MHRRLDLAFCLGLANEASIVADIFEDRGFKVVSGLYQAGWTSKDFIRILDEEKIYQGTDEAVCNPTARPLKKRAEYFHHLRHAQVFCPAIRQTVFFLRPRATRPVAERQQIS